MMWFEWVSFFYSNLLVISTLAPHTHTYRVGFFFILFLLLHTLENIVSAAAHLLHLLPETVSQWSLTPAVNVIQSTSENSMRYDRISYNLYTFVSLPPHLPRLVCHDGVTAWHINEEQIEGVDCTFPSVQRVNAFFVPALYKR